jgi:hypothetical protein
MSFLAYGMANLIKLFSTLQSTMCPHAEHVTSVNHAEYQKHILLITVLLGGASSTQHAHPGVHGANHPRQFK